MVPQVGSSISPRDAAPGATVSSVKFFFANLVKYEGTGRNRHVVPFDGDVMMEVIVTGDVVQSSGSLIATPRGT